MNIHEYISSGVVELYVMGLCTEDDRKELEQLRLQHPELDEAIRKFEQLLESNMMEQGLLPTAETNERVLSALDAMPIAQAEYPPAKVRKMSRQQWMAAAAVLLLIVSGYIIYSLAVNNYELREKLSGSPGIQATIDEDNIDATLPEEDYKIMLDPKITPVAMYGVGDYAACRCTMFWDKKTGKMYMIIHHLPLSSEEEDYQLWGMVNNQPVNIGIIKDEIRGRFIEVDKVPAEATSFIVTLEKAGGSSTPNLQETYLNGKI
jgi:anti-sigma-K factor RskA